MSSTLLVKSLSVFVFFFWNSEKTRFVSFQLSSSNPPKTACSALFPSSFFGRMSALLEKQRVQLFRFLFCTHETKEFSLFCLKSEKRRLTEIEKRAQTDFSKKMTEFPPVRKVVLLGFLDFFSRQDEN